MGRFFPSGALGIIVLLVAGCASQQAHISRTPNGPATFQTIYVEPEADDPLQLDALIGEKLEGQGYTVFRKATGDLAGEGLILLYAYGTGPAINEDGRAGHRLKWLRMRLVDNADQKKVASGQITSGIFDQSPEDEVTTLIAALSDRLQHGHDPVEGTEGNLMPEPAKHDAPVAPALLVKKESEIALSHSRTGKKISQEDSLSDEKNAAGNPWIPRLKSWGFDEWGKGK